MADHQDHHDHHHQGFEVHQVKHDDGSHVYHGIDITKINISSLPKSQQVSCCVEFYTGSYQILKYLLFIQSNRSTCLCTKSTGKCTHSLLFR